MARQWPCTGEEMMRVVHHWVEGCGADVVRTLFEMEGGMVQRVENGFLVCATMSHAVPLSIVPSAGPQEIMAESLVDLGCCLAWRRRDMFVTHASAVEHNRKRNAFWGGMYARLLSHSTAPGPFCEVLRSVQHPSLCRLVWRAACGVLSACDPDAVSKMIYSAASHPVAVTDKKTHASLMDFVRAAGGHVWPCTKGTGVAQYPCASLTMSRPDHLLWIILCVFYHRDDDMPGAFKQLKQAIRSHADEHDKTVVQAIMEEWRLDHIRLQSA